MTREEERSAWLLSLEAGSEVAIAYSSTRSGQVAFKRGAVLRRSEKYVWLKLTADSVSQEDGRKFIRATGLEVGKSSEKILPICEEVKKSWRRATRARRVNLLCQDITSQKIKTWQMSDENLKKLDDLLALIEQETPK